MASTTAEVLLYFGTDEPKFKEAVTRLRFLIEPEMTTRELIELISPIYNGGYDAAERDIGSQ